MRLPGGKAIGVLHNWRPSGCGDASAGQAGGQSDGELDGRSGDRLGGRRDGLSDEQLGGRCDERCDGRCDGRGDGRSGDECDGRLDDQSGVKWRGRRVGQCKVAVAKAVLDNYPLCVIGPGGEYRTAWLPGPDPSTGCAVDGGRVDGCRVAGCRVTGDWDNRDKGKDADTGRRVVAGRNEGGGVGAGGCVGAGRSEGAGGDADAGGRVDAARSVGVGAGVGIGAGVDARPVAERGRLPGDGEGQWPESKQGKGEQGKRKGLLIGGEGQLELPRVDSGECSDGRGGMLCFPIGGGGAGVASEGVGLEGLAVVLPRLKDVFEATCGLLARVVAGVGGALEVRFEAARAWAGQQVASLVRVLFEGEGWYWRVRRVMVSLARLFAVAWRNWQSTSIEEATIMECDWEDDSVAAGPVVWCEAARENIPLVAIGPLHYDCSPRAVFGGEYGGGEQPIVDRCSGKSGKSGEQGKDCGRLTDDPQRRNSYGVTVSQENSSGPSKGKKTETQDYSAHSTAVGVDDPGEGSSAQLRLCPDDAGVGRRVGNIQGNGVRTHRRARRKGCDDPFGAQGTLFGIDFASPVSG